MHSDQSEADIYTPLGLNILHYDGIFHQMVNSGTK